MPAIRNPLFVQHRLVCQDCGKVALIDQAESAGWTVGMLIPEDRSSPDVGKCSKCHSYKMKVVEGPQKPPPPPPVGWTKIPRE